MTRVAQQKLQSKRIYKYYMRLRVFSSPQHRISSAWSLPTLPSLLKWFSLEFKSSSLFPSLLCLPPSTVSCLIQWENKVFRIRFRFYEPTWRTHESRNRTSKRMEEGKKGAINFPNPPSLRRNTIQYTQNTEYGIMTTNQQVLIKHTGFFLCYHWMT